MPIFCMSSIILFTLEGSDIICIQSHTDTQGARTHARTHAHTHIRTHAHTHARAQDAVS